MSPRLPKGIMPAAARVRDGSRPTPPSQTIMTLSKRFPLRAAHLRFVWRSLTALALLTFGLSCTSTTQIVEEKMVITPRRILFTPGHSDTTVSITHTCTCPFSWHATLRTTVPWLRLGTNFPASLTSDHAAIPCSIDRTALMAPDSTVILITSNAYGADSILVIAQP